ncbi:hypothetical protein [Streptomyces virginiae]|uniref:hypothetical protein n=1 Tax=Streptomyces virginiae TaxID=1961 RepID=UPI003247D483
MEKESDGWRVHTVCQAVCRLCVLSGDYVTPEHPVGPLMVDAEKHVKASHPGAAVTRAVELASTPMFVPVGVDLAEWLVGVNADEASFEARW